MDATEGDLPMAIRRDRLQRIDQLCDRFEAAWCAGDSPRLEVYLSISPAELRPDLLVELIALERELCQRQGESPTIEDYLALFPADAELVRAAFDGDGRPDVSQTGTGRGG